MAMRKRKDVFGMLLMPRPIFRLRALAAKRIFRVVSCRRPALRVLWPSHPPQVGSNVGSAWSRWRCPPRFGSLAWSVQPGSLSAPLQG